MQKILSLSFILIICFLYGSQVHATTFVDTLHKKFKRSSFPYEEVTAIISIETKLHHLKGNDIKQDFFQVLQIHRKAVDIFTRNGWRTDGEFKIDTINAGKIELEVGEGLNLKLNKTLRLKAFVHQCDWPMKKYRGGDIDEFFRNSVLEKAEKCFTHDEKLQ